MEKTSLPHFVTDSVSAGQAYLDQMFLMLEDAVGKLSGLENGRVSFSGTLTKRNDRAIVEWRLGQIEGNGTS